MFSKTISYFRKHAENISANRNGFPETMSTEAYCWTKNSDELVDVEVRDLLSTAVWARAPAVVMLIDIHCFKAVAKRVHTDGGYKYELFVNVSQSIRDPSRRAVFTGYGKKSRDTSQRAHTGNGQWLFSKDEVLEQLKFLEDLVIKTPHKLGALSGSKPAKAKYQSYRLHYSRWASKNPSSVKRPSGTIIPFPVQPH